MDLDVTAVQWFGIRWDAPVCEEVQRIPVPIGETCARCKGVFADTVTQGVALPFIDRWVKAEFTKVEDEPGEAASLGIWPGDFIYFHRKCFMEVIRG